MEGRKQGYSRDGYIVDQGRLTDVPYGCRTSDYNGCGWICVYNLLRCLGDDAPEKELTAALSRRALFRGLLGTSPFALMRYLRKRGYGIKVFFGKKRVTSAAAQTGVGVVLYRHKWGWHYVTCVHAGAGERLRFFNASPGNENHLDTMEDFLSTSVTPFVWLMQVKKPQ